MTPDNKYTKTQKSQYFNGTSNHLEHNENPDYWEILLDNPIQKLVKQQKSEYTALDFGCGKGRNISNLFIKYKIFNKIDGADISVNNIEYCKKNFEISKSSFYCNNGVDISDIKSNNYDFIMSTITLQHIPVYDIRMSLITDIYRLLKKDGIFSFQMGYSDSSDFINSQSLKSYTDNFYDATGTNSMCDVRIVNDDIQKIIEDLTLIGFINFSYTIKPSFSDNQHPFWIYIQVEK